MKVEQQLRDNLKAAADALIVPPPRRAVAPARVPYWRRGPGMAFVAAAAVLVLAIPALFWSSGENLSPLGTPPTGSPDAGEGSPSVASTIAPTTTTPTTSSTARDIAGTMTTLGELTIDDHKLALVATRTNGEDPNDGDPPTATVVLEATAIESDEPTDVVVVGDPASFFWNTVSEDGAICGFSVDEEIDSGAIVSVQLLLTPSLGCSEAYTFIFQDGDLVLDLKTAEGVAREFVESWLGGDGATMADLASPQAMEQAEELSPPSELSFSYCEGAAGSLYCTFEASPGELVVRVGTEPPSRVLELKFLPDN